MKKQQKIIAGGVAFTLAVLSITAVYLPSQAKKYGNEEGEQHPRVVSPIQRGSMWQNMDSRIKQGKAESSTQSKSE